MTRHHRTGPRRARSLVVTRTGITFCSGEKCQAGDEFAYSQHHGLLRRPADSILSKIEAVATELVDHSNTFLAGLTSPLSAERDPCRGGIQTRSNLQAQRLLGATQRPKHQALPRKSPIRHTAIRQQRRTQFLGNALQLLCRIWRPRLYPVRL